MASDIMLNKSFKYIYMGFAICGALVYFGISSETSAEQSSFIKVENARSYEAPPVVKNGAAFVTLKNTGNQDDALIAAKSDIAQKVELHTHLHEDGIMRMRKVERIKVPANGQAILKPMGDHIMLIGLEKPLKPGESFDIKFLFEKAQPVSVKVDVLERSR